MYLGGKQAELGHHPHRQYLISDGNSDSGPVSGPHIDAEWKILQREG
jgi:hypothetical protein